MLSMALSESRAFSQWLQLVVKTIDSCIWTVHDIQWKACELLTFPISTINKSIELHELVVDSYISEFTQISYDANRGKLMLLSMQCTPCEHLANPDVHFCLIRLCGSHFCLSQILATFLQYRMGLVSRLL